MPHQKPPHPQTSAQFLDTIPFPNEIIQENHLYKFIQEALFPYLVFRSEAYIPENKWSANKGDVAIRTKHGDLPRVRNPLGGKEPEVGTFNTEQWRVRADQYGFTTPINAASENISAFSTWKKHAGVLFRQAGLSLDGFVRDRLFLSYSGGNSVLTANAAIAASVIDVSSINGWQELTGSGTYLTVGVTNGLFSKIGPPGSQEVIKVIGSIPDDPINAPLGKGKLILSSGLVGAFPARDAVLADNRSTVIHAGGAQTVDGITAANKIVLQDVINAVTILKNRDVPPCSDGRYHVHWTPLSLGDMYLDPAWRQIYQGEHDSEAYKHLSVGSTKALVHANWYSHTQVPQLANVDANAQQSTGVNALMAGDLGIEMINESGVRLRQLIVVGGEAIVEDTIPEGWMIPGSEAGLNAKVGTYRATSQGVQINVDGVRMTIAFPVDALQQEYRMSWSWTGDWGVPTDQLPKDNNAAVGENPRFKRCVRIVTA